MKTNKTILFSLSLFLILAGPLFAPTDGCTPGFWKNHVDLWIGFSPVDPLDSVFDMTDFPNLADKTLLEALMFKGGKGLNGAARILLRHAVAGILNTAHPRVHWWGLRIVGEWAGLDWRLVEEHDVKGYINEALLSGERSFMLNIAAELDGANNRNCPPKDTW